MCSFVTFQQGGGNGDLISPGTLNSTDADLGYTFLVHDTNVARLQVGQDGQRWDH